MNSNRQVSSKPRGQIQKIPSRSKHKKNRLCSRLTADFRMQPKPMRVLLIGHALALIVSLLVFALFHHVLPRALTPDGTVSTRALASTVAVSVSPTPNATPQTLEAQSLSTSSPSIPPTPSPSPTADPIGYFGTKFKDKFITGAAQYTDTSYVSENLNVNITRYDQSGVVFYVADIYVRDISCFKGMFADDTYGKGFKEGIESLSKRVKSIITINGDYIGARQYGVCMRNGTVYRNDSIARDVCVIYWDGSMQCYNKKSFDCDAAVAAGAYQILYFGPALMDGNGTPIDSVDEFYYDINGRNPRSALGYFEPGHYCFITVDGRSSESKGLNLKNLAKLANALGCVQAYNLDGGKTATMAFGGKMVNDPPDGGRECSDFLCIMDTIS